MPRTYTGAGYPPGVPRLRAIAGALATIAATGVVATGVAGAGSGVSKEDLAGVVIQDLTAELAGAVPVPGGAPAADVPECAGVRAADEQARTQGTVVEQGYGVAGAGVHARVVVFETPKAAQRYYKAVTGANARDCVLATNQASAPGAGDGPATSDLERGALPGVKPSKTYSGTLTLGPTTIGSYEAFARRGRVVLQVSVGGAPAQTDATSQTAEAWITESVRAF
jgi:hypothetical protein